jgi:hypothetical protein
MSKASENKTYTRLLGEVLGRYCGKGNQMKFDDVAERAGCTTSLLIQLKNGTGAVGFDTAMEIIRELPEEAAGEFFAGLGFTGLHRIDGAEPCFEEAHHHCAQTTAYFAEAYLDRRIDHQEQRRLVKNFFPKVIAVFSRCMRHAT